MRRFGCGRCTRHRRRPRAESYYTVVRNFPRAAVERGSNDGYARHLRHGTRPAVLVAHIEPEPGGTPNTADTINSGGRCWSYRNWHISAPDSNDILFLAANYTLCCLALVVLRHREPDLPRPYQAWGYPWSVWLVAAGSVVFLLGMLAGDMLNGLAALGLLAVGLIGRALFTWRVTPS